MESKKTDKKNETLQLEQDKAAAGLSGFSLYWLIDKLKNKYVLIFLLFCFLGFLNDMIEKMDISFGCSDHKNAFFIAGGETENFEIESFLVAKLNGDIKNLTIGSWNDLFYSTKKDSVKVAIIASWCVYSLEMLKKISPNEFDFIVLFDDELQVFYTKNNYENSNKIRELSEKMGIFLVNPEILNHIFLPIYMAKSENLKKKIKAYPTILSCKKAGCEILSNYRIPQKSGM